MPNCKYIKQQEIVSYNGGVDWQDVIPAQYRKGQLIEHDSEDCTDMDTIYRWRKLTGVYMCVDDVKYEKLILDESYDGGLSWYPAYPSQYTTGETVGVDEDYCNDKFVGQYYMIPTGGGGGTIGHSCPLGTHWNGVRCVQRQGVNPVDPIKIVKCDGNPELTSADTAYYSYSSYYSFALISAEIGKCVTSIAARAFSQNTSITNISIPDSVTTIGSEAFRYCISLSGMNTTIPGELNIPSGVTSIGDSAFRGCTGLTSIVIPSTVTSIGYYAFSGCVGTTSITVNATTPPSLGNDYVFLNTNNCPIYVPCGSFWAYRESWNILTSRLYPIGGESCVPTKVKYDYNGTSRTYYCDVDTVVDSGDTDGIGVERSAITGVYIGSCATEIDNSAFRNCSSLPSIVIPSGVTSIGTSAFNGCSGLTSVTIENGVTTIGDYAFQNCRGLTSVTIPSGVTSIGRSAFDGCSGLTSVTISNSVTSIGNDAFSSCISLPVEGYIRYADTYAIEATDRSLTSYALKNNARWIGNWALAGCSGLTSIDIPDSVISIGDYAFYRCSGLTTCTIGSGVTSIGTFAFEECSGLTSIDIPDSVTSIGARAFSNCSKLGIISVPNGVTSIEEYTFYNCTGLTSCTIGTGITSIDKAAFMNCSGLTSIDIPDSVTSIGESAFAYCSGFTSVIIGNSVTTIGNDAFRWCRRLRSVTIGNSVTTIGYKAFQGCTSLRSVTIPNSVTRISYEAFYDCSGLTSITVEATTPPGLGTSVFYGSNCPIYVPVSSVEAYKAATDWRGYRSRIQAIPTKWIATYSDSSVTSAECGSSSEIVQNEINTTNLVSLEIGDCVTSIGDYAFTSCSGLTSCTIGSDVTSIGEMAFRNCNSLTSITIPNSVTRISYGAFIYCTSLTSIDIPSGVTSIGSYAFRYCSGLTSVTVEATTPPTLGGTSVFADTNNCPIYVPCESVEAYKTASGWSTYASRITCQSFEGKWLATYTGGTTSSAECGSSSEIVRYEIESNNLVSVEIGDCVTSIGENAFGYCSSLTSVTIPDTVTSIGGSAFIVCSGLTSINIPDSVTSIGDSAFRNCFSLTTCTIGNGVTSIGTYAFLYCSGLTSVTVEATTPPTIGSSAFDNTNNCPIYVPAASVETYKAASGWSTYASRIQAIT